MAAGDATFHLFPEMPMHPKEVFNEAYHHWGFLTATSDDDFEGQLFDREEAGRSGQLGNTTITFAEQTARYIRITQTGTNALYHWSIYEFDVYRRN
jgi:hypothetical protein